MDARTPVQAQPEEQPRDSSSTDIIILPMDSIIHSLVDHLVHMELIWHD